MIKFAALCDFGYSHVNRWALCIPAGRPEALWHIFLWPENDYNDNDRGGGEGDGHIYLWHEHADAMHGVSHSVKLEVRLG